MIEINIDSSSINAFASSYHKLCKINKINIIEKINLPSLNSYAIINAKLNIKSLFNQIIKQQEEIMGPLFTLTSYNKLKSQLKSIFKKSFHQKLKQVNQGNLLILKPGQSIKLRSDHFCLNPHSIYTILIPLQKCQLNSASIAISSKNLQMQANNEEQLFIKIHEQQVTWQYSLLDQGDLVIIGRDCVYGSFRNDSTQIKHYVQMRWIINQYSSSSSNSS